MAENEAREQSTVDQTGGLKIRKKSEGEQQGGSRPDERASKAPVASAGFDMGYSAQPVGEPVVFEQSATTEDFAALLESSGGKTPARRRLDVGQKVEGQITSITERFIFVDLGGRTEGIAHRDQFQDEEGHLEVEEGQTREFFVVSVGAGGIELGKFLAVQQTGIEALEQARETGMPVTGKVTAKNKGGFDVEIQNLRAFCPASQIDLHSNAEADSYIGQTLQFRVMDVREGGRNIVVSRAQLLRDAARRAREEAMKKIQVGAILTGTVRSITDYGVFVDLGGVDGLVHISELGWSSVDKPGDVVEVGQQLTVKVLELEDREDRKGNKTTRIALSVKQAQADPWESVQAELQIGQVVSGKVVRIAQFGAFVELKAGVDGLVPLRELSWKHVNRAEDVVKVGQQVSVQVQDVDLARRRISLSLRAAEGDPWNKVADKLTEGQEVSGKVEKVEDFGAFVDLGDGVTALLPRSEMTLGKNETPHSRYKRGQDVTARVLTIQPEQRRIALSLKEGAELEQARDAARSGEGKGGKKGGERRGDQVQRESALSTSALKSSGNFGGTLGELFQLKNKK
jgi:small subunit ribosomal protein S1